jgi:hypothetical protein
VAAKPNPKMMEVSLHKSVDVLCGYIRRADLFRDHVGSAFLRSDLKDNSVPIAHTQPRRGTTVGRE